MYSFMWKMSKKTVRWQVSSKTCTAPHNLHMHLPANAGNWDSGCKKTWHRSIKDYMQSGVQGGTSTPCRQYSFCYYMTDFWHHVNKITVIWCMSHEQRLPLYHQQRVQAMGPVDFPDWVQFSQWYLQQCNTQPLFPYLLFTDEACFMREAMFNSRNSSIWDEDDPHATLQWHQQQFAVSAWAGTVSDHCTRLYLLQIMLNAYINRQLLQALPELLRTCHYGYEVRSKSIWPYIFFF